MEDEDNNMISLIILLGFFLLIMLKYGVFNVSFNYIFGILEWIFGMGNEYLKGDCIFV